MGYLFFVHLVHYSCKNVPDTLKLEGICSTLPTKLLQMDTSFCIPYYPAKPTIVDSANQLSLADFLL